MTLHEAAEAAHLSSWTAEIALSEDSERTIAVVTLQAGRRRLEERGLARRSPLDPNLPRVGDDLAVARALSLLAHDLFSDAVAQLESTTHHAAGIREA